jgi:predicted RecA/RadA family phage recombinase
MKNFVQPGHVMEYVNAGAAIASGDVVAFPWGCGIATGDIAATTGVGSLAVSGVFSLKKEAALVIAQGDIVYWDDTANEVDKTSSNNKLGYAFKAALAGDANVDVKLVEGNGDAT